MSVKSKSRWLCVYQGFSDVNAKSGHVAPSWDSFDKRVWERGKHQITLTNKFAGGKRREARPPPGKITTYQVVLSEADEILGTFHGHDHAALVREARMLSDKLYVSNQGCKFCGQTGHNIRSCDQRADLDIEDMLLVLIRNCVDEALAGSRENKRQVLRELLGTYLENL